MLIASCDTLQAQITPDRTLGTENSTVAPDIIQGVPSDRIDGGVRRGANLFHSFKEFKVGEGRGAYFSNPSGIENIFSRVTGSNVSQVQGKLGVLGDANVFLINPNGIVFGPNARLDMKGSFLATTANRLIFDDKSEFSTINLQTPPLLTISIPVALQFATNPQAILVQGAGHNLRENQLQPIDRGNTDTGLKVQPGRTLALVGGDITLEGGTLTAEGGRIELGSVDSGVVSLLPTTEGWILGYEGVKNFRDVNLSQAALADASSGFAATNSGLSLSGGSIQIQGKDVALTDGSIVLIQNMGLQPSGNIRLNASDSLKIAGTTLDEQVPSGLVNETLMGKGGNISITTQRLLLQDGGQLGTRTFSSLNTGVSGSIDLTATDLLQVNGFSSINPQFSSNISAISFASAKAGDITILTRQLTVLNGGFIASGALGDGDGGELRVTSTESIDLSGINPFTLFPSSLGASTLGRGDSGSLIINTSTLSVRNGATVSASTGSDGNAGSLMINASRFVEVSGKAAETNSPSFVQSSALRQPLALRKIYRLPDVPTGNSGDIAINTAQLSIKDGAQVNLSNDGKGSAGTLTINANFVFLDNNGGITALTASGNGGNILLNVRDNLYLRNDSLVSANAGGIGNGGNIDINTKFLIASPQRELNGNDIIAKAERGTGGNIKINAQGIFGIAKRPAIPKDQTNDIDASSEFGISGTITFNTPDVDPSRGIVALPERVIDSNALIANSCIVRSRRQGRFVITGTGGLPTQPDDLAIAAFPTYELIPDDPKIGTTDHSQQSSPSTVEADGIYRLATGEVILGRSCP